MSRREAGYASVVDRVGAAWGFTKAERDAAKRYALQNELAQAKRRLNKLSARLMAGDESAVEEAEHMQRNLRRIRAELTHEHGSPKL